MTHILSAVAWPYANGPRHIGHVAGFGVPSDVFSRYMRMAGHDVLMVSGTDEHGTPILVAADEEGLSARELADRNNRLIVEDLVALGLSYDLFTRTTAGNHYHVVQDMFTTVRDNGYMVQQVTRSAISPSTGRTLPDRYIEGTCPICGAEGARGDQCDTCGNQLDPTDLISPRSRINGETPEFVETTHWFLDLPALAQALGAWLDEREASGTWRPNVIKFSQNLLGDIRPRAMTRDIDWGIPVPGWEDQPTKRLYVWFDAVIGYLSASVEWARRSGDPEAWRAWWNDPQALSYYFMGKDNIVFHSQIWPAELLGYNGQGAAGGEPGRLGVLNLPTEVVSSEFLTMEGKKFSSSHGIVIYVRDFLVALPGRRPALLHLRRRPGDRRRGLHVGRVRAAHQRRVRGRLGRPGQPHRRHDPQALRRSPRARRAEGDRPGPARLRRGGVRLRRRPHSHHRQKAALGEAMRLVGEANKYVADTQPFKLKGEDPATQARLATVLHTLAQAVTDLNLMLSPFLPHAANDVDRVLGGSGRIAPMPRIEEVAELDPEHLPEAFDGRTGYPIITGDYQDAPIWGRHPVTVGTPVAKPTPVLIKLDESIVEAELARYADAVPDDVTGA